MFKSLNREPTIIIGAIGELIRQIIPMLVIFGLVAWTDSQIAAVFMVVSASLAFITVLFTRSQVAPVQDVQTALDMPAGSTQKQLDKVIEKQN